MALGNTSGPAIKSASAMKSRANSTKKSVRLAVKREARDMENRAEERTRSAGSDHLSGHETDEDKPSRQPGAAQDAESKHRDDLMINVQMAKTCKSISDKFPVLKV
jgi:hypothetical protein